MIYFERNVKMKNSFSEISYSEYEKIISAKTNEEILDLLFINPDKVKIKYSDFFIFTSWLNELPEEIDTSFFIYCGRVVNILPVHMNTFGKYREAKEILKKMQANKENDKAAINFSLLKLFLNIPEVEIKEMPFDFCFTVYKNICEQMVKLIEREAQYLNTIPTPEEKRAGIDNLNKFGDMYFIDSLCGDDLTKRDLILNLEYEEIFWKQVRDFEISKYFKRLNKVAHD